MFRICHILTPCVFIVGCFPTSPSGTNRHFLPVRQLASTCQSPARPDSPKLKRLNNGHFRVTKPWTVQLNGRRWHVPAGYATNGITGPSWLRKTLGNGVNHPETWAAVFHDWLFTQSGVSRAQADRMFHDLLIAYGVPPLKARLMHSGVSAYSASKSIR